MLGHSSQQVKVALDKLVLLLLMVMMLLLVSPLKVPLLRGFWIQLVRQGCARYYVAADYFSFMLYVNKCVNFDSQLLSSELMCSQHKSSEQIIKYDSQYK